MPDTFQLHEQFIRPQYGSACFSDLPQFITSVLVDGQGTALKPSGFDQMPQRYRHVVLFFVDAFGWRFFQPVRDRYPFLQHFDRAGSVTRLTSQFPSTTTAHATTIYTGLPVGQHGLFEWHIYEPSLDAMIIPLTFSFAGDKNPETLRATGARPQDILPTQTVSQALARQGVATYLFQYYGYAQSSYSSAMVQGGRAVPFKTLPEALVNLSRLLDRSRDPTFTCLYYGDIDTILHDYGPGSPQVAAQIDAFLQMAWRWLQQELAAGRQDTLLLLTADHGQVNVYPETTVYLNHLPAFGRLEPWLRTNRHGQLLVPPGGSSRDVFLYVHEAAVDDAQALLQSALAGIAEVYRVSDLIDAGFFGPLPVSDAFLARVGNLVILPYEGEAVWWYEKDRFEQKFYGQHGGLTPHEMEIPLLVLPFTG